MSSSRFVSILLAVALALASAKFSRAQWVRTSGPNGHDVRSFASIGSNLFAGSYGGGVFLSTNDGNSWAAVDTGLTNPYVYAVAVSGPNLFAGTLDVPYSGGVFLSTNNGDSWRAVNNGLIDSDAFGFAVSGTNLFTVTSAGVFRSLNYGTNWAPVFNPGLIDAGSANTLAVSGTNLFVGTGNGVFLSTNDGASWTAVNSGLTNTIVNTLAVSGTNLFAGSFDGRYSKGVFLSTNNGTSWKAANTGLPNTFESEAFAVSGTNLFAGSYGGGVFLLTNNDASWTEVSTGLPSNSVLALGVNGIYLFAGISGSGVWRRPLSEMVGQSAVAKPEATTQSLRCYPNPLTQSTTISFTPKASGYAEISIVNQLGVEVARIFSGELDAGEHTFRWDSGTLGGYSTNGTYQCVVRMNGAAHRVGMILAR